MDRARRHAESCHFAGKLAQMSGQCGVLKVAEERTA
jgi:hypothetical protein